jgi:thiamine-phosphate pyrophosphorylase
MKNKIDLSLYFIVDRALAGRRNVEQIVRDALAGGVTAIQLREKHMSTKPLIAWANKLKAIVSEFGIPLIINDRIDVAVAVDADGVHLGQDDAPIDVARKLLGADKIIGLSAHTRKEALDAEKTGADYIGVGTVFSTSSKKDIQKIIGTSGLNRIRKNVSLPMVAIGGVNENNLTQVMKTGVDGVAIISAIMNSSNPKQTCLALRSVITTGKILKSKHA